MSYLGSAKKILFLVLALLLLGGNKAYAAWCEEIPGYDNYVDCFIAGNEPEGWALHPDANTTYICQSGSDWWCYIRLDHDCQASGAGVCRDSMQGCPADYPIVDDTQICADPLFCCTPDDTTQCEDPSTPFQDCRTATGGCVGPEWSTGTGDCASGFTCCIHNCTGADPSNECKSSCTVGSENQRSDLYCSSGVCCEDVEADHTCSEVGGTCQSYCNGTQTADTTATGCSGGTATCCVPRTDCPGTCEGSCGSTLKNYGEGDAYCDPEECCIPSTMCGGTCVATGDSCTSPAVENPDANANCPSGTKCCEYNDPAGFGTCPEAPLGQCILDSGLCSGIGEEWVPSISDTCDEGDGYQCCVQADECAPTTEDGCTATECPLCGSGGCQEMYRCINMGSDNWRCIEDEYCEASFSDCTAVGECGEDAGCPDGMMCIISGSDYMCICADECGGCVGSELVTIPYTGPIISFTELIGRMYYVLFTLAIVIALVFIVKSGYTIMTSEGNPEKIAQGKEDLTASILGFVFVLLSAVILRLLTQTLF